MNLVRLRTSNTDSEDDEPAIEINKDLRDSSSDTNESENIFQEIEDGFPPILTDYNQQQSTFVYSPRQPETERHFLTDRTDRKREEEKIHNPNKTLQKKKTLKFKKMKDSNVEHFPIGLKSTKRKKPSSKTSQKSEENRAFINAILHKSYPKSFIILCFAFYFVILINLGGQITMKSVSNNTMKNLQLRKNILEYAQERAYKGALIQINCIGSAAQIKGANTAGGAIPDVSGTVVNLQIRVNPFSKPNTLKMKFSWDDLKKFGSLLWEKILLFLRSFFFG